MTDRFALSVGANLGDRAAALAGAWQRLRGQSTLAGAGVSGWRLSPLYETAPVGGVAQPDFLNAVVIGDSAAGDSAAVAAALLALAADLEHDFARVREVRWGPRTLDVDVLAVGSWTSDADVLTVPHPRLAQRAFVLVPWADVDPDFVVPGLGTVADLLAALPHDEVGSVRRATLTR